MTLLIHYNTGDVKVTFPNMQEKILAMNSLFARDIDFEEVK